MPLLIMGYLEGVWWSLAAAVAHSLIDVLRKLGSQKMAPLGEQSSWFDRRADMYRGFSSILVFIAASLTCEHFFSKRNLWYVC